MPRIARVFIKTGLIYFLVSLLLGLVAEFNWLQFPGMVPLFWHLLMVGWITQIIFGVSMWMFPGRTREEGFKAQLWGWLTYIFLNVGLLVRVIAEPATYYVADGSIWMVLIVISAVSQVVAALTYIIELWPRIQSKEQRRRQRHKKRKQKNSKNK